MSQAKPPTPGTDAPDAEVELSAQDLLELTASCESNKPAQQTPAGTVVVSVEPSVPVPQLRTAPKPARRPMSRVSVAASLSLAAGLVVASYFVMKASEHAARSVTQAQAEVPRSESPAAAPEDAGKPVRFANPFDAKEVFEFPAGTSEAQARDAVAEILMTRAMQRQRKFDARMSSNN